MVKSFLDHFLVEYKYGGYYQGKNPIVNAWMLNESAGLLPGLDEMLNLIMNQIKSEWTDETLSEGDLIEVDLYKTLKNHPNNFFGEKSILSLVIPDSSEPVARGGSYEGSGVAEYQESSDTLQFADIEIKMRPPRRMPQEIVLSQIEDMIAHEMIHAYEDYQRQKAKKGDLSDYLNQTNYGAMFQKDVATDLRMYTYLLNPMEQRAFVASFAQEIKKLKRQGILGDDPRNMTDVLKKTQFWNNYEHAHNFVEVVKNIKNCTWGGQQRILDAYNKVSPEQFRVGTVKALQKIVPQRWYKAMDYLKVRIAKQLALLYSEKVTAPTDDFS